ncbi:MAG: RnfABCDGE type electron transport complex subunit G [Lachnospiraceae bacterium]|nr:RnfABCDGE type electron transport complex subunit G [Lachnospiraceae bacterium]
MKNIIKDTIILLVITLVSGVSLGYVFNITKDARANQEDNTKAQAYKTVFPDAKNFAASKIKDFDKINSYISKIDKEAHSNDSDYPNAPINASIDEIVEARDGSGKCIGYVITVTDNEAYGGKITFSVGIGNDKTIYGISFLSINETPGLGMRAKEDSFINQFKNKKIDYVKYSKSGATSENEIDALSGATITTNAVTNGTNAAVYCFDYISNGGGENE